MQLKRFLSEALMKGENLKEEITSEILRSKILNEVLKSDLFAKAVATVLKTKDEVSNVIRVNIKNVMRIMDVPSKNDLTAIQRKLDQIEKLVDRAGKREITVKSLKSIKSRTKKKISRVKK